MMLDDILEINLDIKPDSFTPETFRFLKSHRKFTYQLWAHPVDGAQTIIIEFASKERES
jgi:hypothetical protein